MVKKKMVQPDRSQMTTWNMHLACWMSKVTKTHSQYVILIASPQSQWLHESTSLLHYMYTDCIVISKFSPTNNMHTS